MILLVSILILLAVAIIVVMYVHSRAKEGVGVFELTDKDRADLREARREFRVRRILAKLLGGIGSICFIGGVATLIQSRADLQITIEMIVIGLFLAFCAVLLLRGSK
jgi:hypothetical protein